MKYYALMRCAVIGLLLGNSLQAARAKPNIVFVMIDDLGAEAVGAYGGESYKTPHMDKLAAQGMLFNNAFAQPMCMISRATLMSGRYGFRSGLPRNNDPVARAGSGWGQDEITLANLLQDAGYTTAISGKWHLCQHDRHLDHLTEKGFDYQNAWAWIKGDERTRRFWGPTYFRDRKFITDGPEVFGPDVFCQYITDFMAKHKDDEKPFFAYYPMVLVHGPWPQTPDNIDDPQPGWKPEDNLREYEDKKLSVQNYKAMVEYTDKLIGKVAAAIEDLGIAEDTLLIVTADNGSFKGFTSRYKGDLLKGGKGNVADIGTRVPFFAVWKGKITPGSINTNLVDFTDCLPTLVGLGGGKLPKNVQLDGQSFLGQMLGVKNAPSRKWVFAGNLPNAMARADKFSLDAEGQLYDLREDRYAPKLVKKADFTEIHMTYHKMLKEAMQSLNHPYTGVRQPKKRKDKVKKRKGDKIR